MSILKPLVCALFPGTFLSFTSADQVISIVLSFFADACVGRPERLHMQVFFIANASSLCCLHCSTHNRISLSLLSLARPSPLYCLQRYYLCIASIHLLFLRLSALPWRMTYRNCELSRGQRVYFTDSATLGRIHVFFANALAARACISGTALISVNGTLLAYELLVPLGKTKTKKHCIDVHAF